METVKDKIQRIKLARMGEEYRFVAEVFSGLETHLTKSKPDHIFFLKDNIPVMIYDPSADYLWCHNEIIWSPLLKIILSKSPFDHPAHTMEIKEMRKILSHFALAYFDMTETTISMAHSYITDTWKTLKFKRTYIW